MSRIAKLAAYPLRAIDTSPLPQGWLPPRNAAKEKSYLFPDEEAAFQGNQRIPLVRRLLVGFCAREGPRKENAVTVQWTDFAFENNREVMQLADDLPLQTAGEDSRGAEAWLAQAAARGHPRAAQHPGPVSADDPHDSRTLERPPSRIRGRIEAESPVRGRGGIGRRTRFRFWHRKM